MARFFDDPVLSDEQEECKAYTNGNISNEAYWNDYRNRMPFHYIEDPNTDGYYYWNFGATMEIKVTLEDDVAFSEGEINQYVKISEYFQDSKTKKLQFILKDFRGVQIDEQTVNAEDLEIENDEVSAKYKVYEKLSATMVPNDYRLYIYILDSVTDDNGETQVNFQKCITEQGILLRVRS